MSAEGGERKTKDSAHKWTTAGVLGAALITAIAGIVVARITHSDSSQAAPTPGLSQSFVVASPTPSPSKPAPLPLGRTEEFDIPFGGSSSYVKIVWPDSAAVRVAGELSLEGAHAADPCMVKVRFEARDLNKKLVGQDMKDCSDNRDAWPKYGPAYLRAAAKVNEVTIIILFKGGEVARAVCIRDGGCDIL